ncbi:Potassium-transporting ATPase KdpC subunit [Streptomyces microflavus]
MTNTFPGTTTRLLGAGLRALLVLTLVCGVIYPLAVTGAAQALLPGRANGSAVTSGGRTVGSELIGQGYDLPAGKGQGRPGPTSGGSSRAPPTGSPPTASTRGTTSLSPAPPTGPATTRS